MGYSERRALWRSRVPEIREARSRNVSYTEIGQWYEVSRCMIYLVCKRYGIKAPKKTSARTRQRKRERMRRVKPALALVPIDPVKAARITEAKRAFWEKGARFGAWVHPYARLAVSRSAAPASTATLNISSRRSA